MDKIPQRQNRISDEEAIELKISSVTGPAEIRGIK